MTPRQLLKNVFPPMLATLAENPPANDAGWSYELKYDGFRAICAVSGGEAAMLSRNELDLSKRFPRVFQDLAKLKSGEIVIDGEVVVLDETGAPRFQLLQQSGGNEHLIVFDILWLDGEDLRRKTYLERRKILRKALAKSPARIAVAEPLDLGGADAIRKAADEGWEGIIAKRNTSVYEPRRSKEWLKIKALQQQEFVIVGWQESSASGFDIGSLHLAVQESGVLRYAGKVGTGFSAKLRSALRAELGKDEVPASLVADAPRAKDSHWVNPRLVAQVAFTEWTSDHRLRHPSFLGLREDKSVREVVREVPVPVKASKKAVKKTSSVVTGATKKKRRAGEVQESRVTMTNPDRLLYPRDGLTKTDVANYYDAVAEALLGALELRPLSIEHWNQGIDKPSWYQQGLGKEAPSWLTLVETPLRTTKKTIRHLVVDSRDSLRWLAQMSVLTIHMWSARATNLEQPDWLISDLDPAKGKGIEQAIEAAIVMRGLLENLQLPSVPKTSGKRGIHVLIPLAPGYSHEEVTGFACNVAETVSAHVPFMTVERTIAQRKGRLYLDCLQNGYGKTIVAPYSLRAIDGAPVSAPLDWSEVTKKLDPLKFNIKTMAKRLDKVGDLFAPMLGKGAKLPKLS